MHDNTISFAKGIELERCELFTYIYAQTMNKNSCLFLNKAFIIHEDSKSFRFLSKKIYPHLTTVIINRTYKIPLLTIRNMFDGLANVRCTNCSLYDTLYKLLFRITSMCCFSTMQLVHTLDGAFNCGNLLTICLYYNVLRLLRLGSLYLQRHKWLLFSRVVWK